ncbi:UNVERIFIED_CONTAM: hypothetical protein HDU68_012339 [Siphonaria sp. JEL0065]|nr:hypothetical protein HDU68_012339 [Siphonaria sp. JEL0065]
MGFNIQYTEYTGGYDNVLGPRIQAGITDVVMEMWSTGIPVVWYDHGSIGYQGRSGMYIPTWLADKYPTLASQYVYERLIDGLKINATVNWLGGDAFNGLVDQALQNGTAFIFYNWATPMSFGTEFPDVVKLLNLISIAENEMNTLLKNMMVNDWTYDVAVCDWMKNNVDEWKSWIPAPPQVITTFLLLFVPQHETPTVELLLFYFQVVNLIFGIEITNFNGMQDLEKFLALASLDLDGMVSSCPAPLSGVAKQLFRFVLPCLFFINTTILYYIAKFLKQYNPQLMEKLLVYLPLHSKNVSVKVIFLRIFQIVITFVLMPLVEASLAILDCRNVMGRVVDFQAPDVVCFQGEHLPAAIFSIFVLVVLLGAYPGFIALQLYRINKAGKLKYDEDEANLTIIDELNMTLYADYRRAYFYMGPVLIWEKGILVLLFKLLNGKVMGIGFTYVCILAVLCFQRIYIQPYLYGIEAYMNREIVLCWLVLMAMNLSTLEYDQNIGGAVTFILVLPAVLHVLRWGHSAWHGHHASMIAGSAASTAGGSVSQGPAKLGRHASQKGNSIENLSGKKGGKKGGSGVGSSAAEGSKAGTNVGAGSQQGVVRKTSVLGGGLVRTASANTNGPALGKDGNAATTAGRSSLTKPSAGVGAAGLATPAQAGLAGNGESQA